MKRTSKPVLLVDIDGVTVLGRRPDGASWFTDLKRDFGFDKAALRQHFFAPFWADIVTGKDKLLPRLEQALRAMGSNANALTLRDYWFSNDDMKNDPFLGWLADRRHEGHRVMFATNQDHDRARYLMQTVGLAHAADGIYHSASIGFAKPEPGFFDYIQKVEDRSPSDLLLIDDSEPNIAAAKSAGWQTCRFTHGETTLDQLTTAIVSGDAGSASPSTTSK